MADELTKLLAEHDDWLAVERGLAMNSLAAYRRDLRRYAVFLRARDATDPSRIGEDVVHAYVRHLETLEDDDGGRRLAASSVAAAVVAVPLSPSKHICETGASRCVARERGRWSETRRRLC